MKFFKKAYNAFLLFLGPIPINWVYFKFSNRLFWRFTIQILKKNKAPLRIKIKKYIQDVIIGFPNGKNYSIETEAPLEKSPSGPDYL